MFTPTLAEWLPVQWILLHLPAAQWVGLQDVITDASSAIIPRLAALS